MKTYLSLCIVSLLFTACVLSDVESDAQQIIEDIENVIEQSSMYEVRFVFDWNSVDFPNDYLSSAHFSQLVGWVHEKDHSYFKEGELASSSIEQMAETGSTTTLVNELEALIDQSEGLATFMMLELKRETSFRTTMKKPNHKIPLPELPIRLWATVQK
ncbi:MAG: hypothetical protein ACJ0PV_05630 [Flavobacteriaceae bacterium]|jgi:hypothetical protein|nr:MAG: hypothetical protein CBC41_005550 [Flavobacteriaceae bacterium TMED81]|tara:strand:- start:1156 stop:1629 length:474 start_codon:yes stop_codon:yes gene_type:complete